MLLQNHSRLLVLSFAVSGLLSGCGLGGGADVGDDTSGQTGAGGSTTASGGSTTASGGSTTSAGGSSTASGGSSTASGGAPTGSGGGSTGGIRCGSNVCGAGLYCCNASCGMCAPMGAACIQIACDPGPAQDAGTGTPTKCQTDTDCHVSASYCGGCNCLGLAAGETVPACTGTMVQCFADPCMSKVAACVNGACVAQ